MIVRIQKICILLGLVLTCAVSPGGPLGNLEHHRFRRPPADCEWAAGALSPAVSETVGAVRLSTSEHSLDRQFEAVVLPWFKEQGISGRFQGERDVELYYRIYRHPKEKGAIVFSHGFSESHSKYAELAYNLYENGYSVYILDHRGHGKSGRETNNPVKVHVNKFNDYVEDLGRFVDEVVKPDQPKKVILMGHSMGAPISALYAAKNSHKIDGVVVSAPMFKIDLRGAPAWVVDFASRGMSLLGMGKSYAFGQGNHTGKFEDFTTNQYTGSLPRFNLKKTIWGEVPHAYMGGASFKWVTEAIRGGRRARRQAKDITVPTLVFEAENDHVVKSKGIDEFCAGVAHCKRVVLPGAHHDIHLEKDSVRIELFQELMHFLNGLEGP